MLNFITDYPKDLTNKQWQKAKSLKDKMMSKTKTGLGKLLDAAEKNWNKINWDSLDSRSAMSKVDQASKFKAIKEIQFAKAVATAEQKGPVAVARKALMAASKKAHEVSRNDKISKDAAAKATEISKGLLDLEKNLREIKLDDFDDAAKRFQQLMDMQLKKLKADIDNLEKALKKVLANPTRDTWNDEAKQKCRSVGNTLGNYDDFKEHWKVWKKFDGLQADNHPQLKKGCDPEREKAIVVGLVKEMLPHIKKLKAIA